MILTNIEFIIISATKHTVTDFIKIFVIMKKYKHDLMAKMTSSCHDNNRSGMQFDTWNVEGVIAHE